MNHWTECIDF